MVTDSKTLSSQPRSTREPTVTNMVPAMDRMAYRLMMKFQVVRSMTLKATATDSAIAIRVPSDRLS